MVDLKQSVIECLKTLGGQIRRGEDKCFKQWENHQSSQSFNQDDTSGGPLGIV